MTSDDQHFLDILSGISSDIRKFSANVADKTEAQFDALATSIRKTLADTPWLPASARPPPPPPPSAPLSLLARTHKFVCRNRALTAAIVAFFGTGALFLYYQRSSRKRVRRAARAPNGARREVVVIAGPASSALTKSLALDLERRGFIVYVVVHSVEEEGEVHAEARTDIRPLNLDLVEPLTSQHAIERFNQLLATSHHAFAGAHPHQLRFTGLVIVPDLLYPSGPIETVSAEQWSDALNAKVVGTVATTQAFLPTVCEHKAQVLVLTPSIVSSLKPAFHGVESTVVGALEGFTATLQRELGTLGVGVSHIRMGSFDCSAVGGRQHMQALGSWSGITLKWPASLRNVYAQNYLASSRIGDSHAIFSDTGSHAKGGSLRELHHAVFDGLTRRRTSSVIRVGRGSVAYEMVGSFVPAGLVGWILGIRPVSLEEVAESKLADSSVAWEKVERTA